MSRKKRWLALSLAFMLPVWAFAEEVQETEADTAEPIEEVTTLTAEADEPQKTEAASTGYAGGVTLPAESEADTASEPESADDTAALIGDEADGQADDEPEAWDSGETDASGDELNGGEDISADKTDGESDAGITDAAEAEGCDDTPESAADADSGDAESGAELAADDQAAQTDPACETAAPGPDALSGVGSFHIIVDGQRYDGGFSELVPFGVTLWLHAKSALLTGVTAAETACVRLDPEVFPADQWQLEITETDEGGVPVTLLTAVPLSDGESAAGDTSGEASESEAIDAEEATGSEEQNPESPAVGEVQSPEEADENEAGRGEDTADGEDRDTANGEDGDTTDDAAEDSEDAADSEARGAEAEDAGEATEETSEDVEDAVDEEADEAGNAEDGTDDDTEEDTDDETDSASGHSHRSGNGGKKSGSKSGGKSSGKKSSGSSHSHGASGDEAEGMTSLTLGDAEFAVTIRAASGSATARFTAREEAWEGEDAPTLVLTRCAGDGAVTWEITQAACRALMELGYIRVTLVCGDESLPVDLAQLDSALLLTMLADAEIDPAQAVCAVTMGGEAGISLSLTVTLPGAEDEAAA